MTDFSSAVVTIGFDLATYSALEDTGSVNITASILNGTLGRNVVVTLSTVTGGTAAGKFNKHAFFSLMKAYFSSLRPSQDRLHRNNCHSDI